MDSEQEEAEKEEIRKGWTQKRTTQKKRKAGKDGRRTGGSRKRRYYVAGKEGDSTAQEDWRKQGKVIQERRDANSWDAGLEGCST